MYIYKGNDKSGVNMYIICFYLWIVRLKMCLILFSYRRGPRGFGFTIRSVRVYVSEHSEYYTIEHLVTKVEEGSPAYQSGIRPNYIITHVHSQPVSNLTHPQLLHHLFAHGNEITLRVGVYMLKYLVTKKTDLLVCLEMWVMRIIRFEKC